MSLGESVAYRSLRKNLVPSSGAIRNHLNIVPLYLQQDSFIIDAQDILTGGGTDASKAANFLGIVQGKVRDNDAETGRQWLEKFVTILMQPDVGEYQVARKIAKEYGKRPIAPKQSINLSRTLH